MLGAGLSRHSQASQITVPERGDATRSPPSDSTAPSAGDDQLSGYRLVALIILIESCVVWYAAGRK